MRTAKVNGLKIKIHDSIDELPIKRFHKYNKYMLIDSGVGSDMNDVNEHISKVVRFINKDDKKNASIELENMRQNLYLLQQGISPKHLAFACLVDEINGVKITDFSDDGIHRIQERLGNVKKKWFDKMIESLKKKIDQDLTAYFTGIFEEGNIKEYYDYLKKRMLLQIEQIKTGEDKSEELEGVEDMMFSFFKPRNFGGGKVEIEYEKEFDSMCLMIAQNLNVDAESMTVRKFYNALEHLKNQAKENKKHGR